MGMLQKRKPRCFSGFARLGNDSEFDDVPKDEVMKRHTDRDTASLIFSCSLS